MSGGLWRSLGPGILFAGAAIGTSHFVQSTRAGAVYGLGLLGVILLANLIKYPAFRFGPQYAAATGRSLLEGYRDISRPLTLLYLLLEGLVFCIIIAATALTTAAICLAVFGLEADARWVGIAVLVIAVTLLMAGGFPLLERLTKIFVALLTVAVVVTTAMVLPEVEWHWAQVTPWQADVATFAFMIALMGFMPSGLELSLLHSVWSATRAEQAPESTALRSQMIDFNIGYVGSVVLALCFVLMGAGVMLPSGTEPAASAGAFADQVIGIFRSQLGDAAGHIVGLSALLVMFSTLLTVLDGMPRMLAVGVSALLRPSEPVRYAAIDRSPKLFVCMALLAVAGGLLLALFMRSFTSFIDFVTITAFLVAPATALMNHLVMHSRSVPPQARPSALMSLWSGVGTALLAALSIAYLAN